MLALFSDTLFAQNVFSGEPVQWVGRPNGYNTNPYNSDYRTLTYRRVSTQAANPLDGRGQWVTTINVAPSGGNITPDNMPGGPGAGWLLISGPSSNRFQNKWNFNGIGQAALNSYNDIIRQGGGNDMGLNMGTAGHYTFVMRDAGYANSEVFIAYTVNAPVTVSRASQGFANGLPVINISTGATPSPNENVYVRYRVNNNNFTFGTSIVQATGSGTSWTATLPAIACQSDIHYYIFTSTRTLAQLQSDSEQQRSMSALRVDDQNGQNYTLSVLPAATGATLTGTTSICEGDSTNLSVSIVGGLSPFSVVLSDGTSNFTITNYSSGNPIAASPGATTTYSLVSVTGANGCLAQSVSGSATVTVNPVVIYYQDSDNDGFGNPAVSLSDCIQPTGYVTNNLDCDDTQIRYTDADNDGFGTTVPAPCGATNTLDCIDNLVTYADGDNDGFGAGPAAPCGVATNTDCLDTNSAVNPGVAEIPANQIDDDCDNQVDEVPAPVFSTITPATCGSTLSNIDQFIFTSIVPGAQGYRWRFTTVGGPADGQVQVVNTLLRAVQVSQVPGFRYGQTFKVEVAVRIQNIVMPYNDTNCLVTTPSITTQLTNCATTVNRIDDAVFANLVRYATGYRFRITDPDNPSNTQTIDRLLREFRLNQITAFVLQFSKQYQVEVAVRNTDGSYLPFGPVCTVTTPPHPSGSLVDAQCDNGAGGAYEVPTLATQIFANAFPGVVGYGFRLSGPGLPGGTAEVVRPLRVFQLADFAAFGLVPGANYNVQVRLIFNANAPAGPYGKTCTIKVPGAARMKPVDFSVVAYPNPFAEGFSLNVNTSEREDISIKTYDMTGRLLEERIVPVRELETATVGSQYPAGVYNVVVSQNDTQQTLRVIKR